MTGTRFTTTPTSVLEAREDKPIMRVRTTITNDAGTVVLDGTALVYTEPLDPPAPSSDEARG